MADLYDMNENKYGFAFFQLITLDTEFIYVFLVSFNTTFPCSNIMFQMIIGLI